MDSKITKKRLSHMLSYDWVKIIFTAVGIILIWSFLFSATSTKLTAAQLFTVHSYRGNNALSADFSTSLKRAKDDVFSYEVIKAEPYEYTSTGKETDTLLTTRLGVGEGDIIFLSPDWDENTAYTEEGSEEVKYKSTYAQTFIQGYYYCLFTFDRNADGSFKKESFFGQMESYLSPFFDDDLRGELNKSKAEQAFRARIKKNKDKRFKTKAQIEEGILLEEERLIKYRDALFEAYGYFDEGLLETVETTITNMYLDDAQETKAYSLNICPDESRAEKMKNVVSYPIKTVQNGQTVTRDTTENMQVCLFNMAEVESDFRFESLLYINSLVTNAKTK